MRTASILAALVMVGLLLQSHFVNGEDLSLVTVRRTQIPKTPDQVELATRSLAKLALGVKLQATFVEKATPRDQFFEQVCGFVPNFTGLLSQLGPSVPQQWLSEQIPGGTNYPTPPCPKVQTARPVYVGEATSVPEFIQRVTGQESGLLANTFARKSIPANSVLVSEFKTVPTSFALQTNANGVLDDPTLAQYSVNTGAVQPDDFFADAPGTALCKTGAGAWPYDEDLLSDALDWNEQFQPAVPRKVTIGVIDSGLIGDFLDLRPKSGTPADCDNVRPGYLTNQVNWALWFAYDDNERQGARCVDSNGNGWIDDVIGIDVTQRIGSAANRYDAVLAYPDHKFYQHGTGVAKLALGGLIRRDSLLVNLRERVNLKFVKVALQVIDPKTGKTGYAIPEESIQSAIEYLADENTVQAYVLNVSSAVHEDFGARLRRTIRELESRGVLVVAAAGNSRARAGIARVNLFPADLGGTELPNVITVAGHNRAGELYETSNRDANLVDIAAPGCDVPTLTAPRDPNTLATGTSFASPLVAFTAALLRYEGLSEPRMIKLRIGLASDYSELLEGNVVASGTLNIPRAVSIWTDYLELAGNAIPLRGYLEGVTSQGKREPRICDVEIDKVLKLASPTAGAADYKGHRVFMASKQAAVPGRSKPCNLPEDMSLQYRTIANELREIPVRAVRDYVRHQLPPNVNVATIKEKLFGED